MAYSSSSWLIALLISMSILLASCASEPPLLPSGPPPDIRLGPVLELLPLKTSSDRVDTLLDNKGCVHVIIAAATSKEIHHVVVAPDGLVQRELVESASSPLAINVAFDSEARLHLLLDSKHLVHEGSTWSAAFPTPWEAAGIKIQNPRFVQGKKGLIWAFTVDGKEVGSKGRWDWFGLGGGFGAGIFIPWHSASMKLVMVPEAAMAEPLWYVLDPQDNLDTSHTMPVVDNNGNLHVVYHASREGMAAAVQPRYARTTLMPLSPPAKQPDMDTSIRSQKLYSFSGSQIPWFGPDRRGMFQVTSAVDPESGGVLVVRAHDSSFALENGKWSYPLQLPLSSFWEPKLVPAGGNAFHLLTTAEKRVLYLLYAGGSWSAPVELGQLGVASGSIRGALDIASDGNNRAFVVWPTTVGIVGRWIDGVGEIRSPPLGATTIPKHLLDFANGKAEMITPGVTTGFAAAAAAGSNGLLAKRLHDSGHWEALVALVLKEKYGDNLGWYYLGRAAEGMALCDASEDYYRISRERSESFWTRCLSIACHGFKIPEILDERVMAVKDMRSAGKCTATPKQNP